MVSGRNSLNPRLLAAGLAAAAGIAASPGGAAQSIHQELEFDASPVAPARAERIYEALLDQKQFSAFSGAPASIEPEAGGAFRIYGGRVTGRRIVQAWRVETWPEGVYSIVRVELTPTKTGVHIVLDQTGFPVQDGDALNRGWSKKIWDPLRSYLYL